MATPFFIVCWILLAVNVRAYRALTLGEEAAASLGVDVDRVRLMVVVGFALEYLRFINEVRLSVFGILLILVVMFLPDGAVSLLRRNWRRRREAKPEVVTS
jgi:ABC-type branched-subunit amino acid transport system permease subunit